MKPEEISLSQEPSNDEYLLGSRIDNLYPEKERCNARRLDELARKIYSSLKPEQQELFNAGLVSFPKWNDVPWASDLARILFARESINKDLIEDVEIKPVSCIQGMSWAFMNLSKISNDTGDWTTDNKRYGSFVQPRHDLVREEIEILRPDVIVGANVHDLVPILGYEDAESDRDTDANCYYYPSKNGFPPFLNCYHFSAIKNDQTCFYDAVMTVADKYWSEIVRN